MSKGSPNICSEKIILGVDPGTNVMGYGIIEVISNKEGYLNQIHALSIGTLALELGAGRHTKEDTIDYSAGIVFAKKVNDYVNIGDTLAYLHSEKEITNEMIQSLEKALVISKKKNENIELIKQIIE